MAIVVPKQATPASADAGYVKINVNPVGRLESVDEAGTVTIYPVVDATNPANIIQDSTHRFVTDVEKALWNGGGSGGASTAMMQFMFVGSINYTRYLYSWRQDNSTIPIASGDSTSGFRYSNCSPCQAPFDGSITSISISVTGVAYSAALVAGSYTLRFEIFEVGFNTEGVSKGYVDYVIPSSSYTIGSWNDSSVLTAYLASNTTSIAITKGKLYGIKFISSASANNIAAARNVSIAFEVTKA